MYAYDSWLSVQDPGHEAFDAASEPVYTSLCEIAEEHNGLIIYEHVAKVLQTLREQYLGAYSWTARRFVDEYRTAVKTVHEMYGWSMETLYVYYNGVDIVARVLFGDDECFKDFHPLVLRLAMHLDRSFERLH